MRFSMNQRFIYGINEKGKKILLAVRAKGVSMSDWWKISDVVCHVNREAERRFIRESDWMKEWRAKREAERDLSL